MAHRFAVLILDGEPHERLVADAPFRLAVLLVGVLEDQLDLQHILVPVAEPEHAVQVGGDVLLCDVRVALAVPKHTLRVDGGEQLLDLLGVETHQAGTARTSAGTSWYSYRP